MFIQLFSCFVQLKHITETIQIFKYRNQICTTDHNNKAKQNKQDTLI